MSEQEYSNTWKESKECKQTAALLEKAQQAEPSKIMGVFLSVYTIQPDRTVKHESVSWYC